MNRLLVMFFVFALCHPCYSGEMYKWVDKNGVTRFSNTPPPKEKAAEVVGKEINYVAPAQQEARDFSGYERSIKKEQSDKVEIEKQKTQQKAYEARSAEANAQTSALDSINRSIESSNRHIRSLLGVPTR